jgi:hypothetical protein
MTTVFDAAAALKQRPAQIQSAVDTADNTSTETRPVNDNPPKASPGVNVTNVHRTEREPAPGEGESAFGAPMSPPALRSEPDREEIRQEVADEVRRMNQRTNQSTDSTN